MKVLLTIWETFHSEIYFILSKKIPRLDNDHSFQILCTLSSDDVQPKDSLI